jgi:hypothetical protein
MKTKKQKAEDREERAAVKAKAAKAEARAEARAAKAEAAANLLPEADDEAFQDEFLEARKSVLLPKGALIKVNGVTVATAAKVWVSGPADEVDLIGDPQALAVEAG